MAIDKKALLGDVSASELRQELVNRLREQIRRNEEEIESLKQQIRQLTPDLKIVSCTPRPGGGGSGGSRTLARNEQPLREIIVQVMREAGTPLKVPEVIDRVQAAGYVSKATNFRGIVNISLANNDELFEKVSRGVYKLRDGQPELQTAGAEQEE